MSDANAVTVASTCTCSFSHCDGHDRLLGIEDDPDLVIDYIGATTRLDTGVSPITVDLPDFVAQHHSHWRDRDKVAELADAIATTARRYGEARRSQTDALRDVMMSVLVAHDDLSADDRETIMYPYRVLTGR